MKLLLVVLPLAAASVAIAASDWEAVQRLAPSQKIEVTTRQAPRRVRLRDSGLGGGS